MVRTPSVGSPSGQFLGSGFFDTFGQSAILSSQPSQSGSDKRLSTSLSSGLWGSSSSQPRSGAQWPLGSGASDTSSKSTR
jgi:hypothetical protein